MIACKECWISRMAWWVSLWLGVSALAVELPSRIHTAESPVRPKAVAVSALKGLTPQVSLRLAAPDLSVVQAEDVLSLQQDAKGRARVGILRLLTDPIRLLGAKSAWTLLPDGTRVCTEEGTPQGGPLSPLLSNVVLDEFDKELARRGLRFVRYADDCNIFVRSDRAGLVRSPTA